jgi:hypothetical protein
MRACLARLPAVGLLACITLAAMGAFCARNGISVERKYEQERQ